MAQTEWCYNYHDPSKSYALNERLYPTRAEQHRFLKAYIQHRSSTSQAQTPAEYPSNVASSFNLDSPAPSVKIFEQESAREQSTEAEIQRLMQETRLWRIANSAQWVAWGIVQAKVEGMDDPEESQERKKAGEDDAVALESDPLDADVAEMAKDAHDRRPEVDEAIGAAEARRGKEAEAEEEEGEGEGEGEAEEEEEEFDYLAYAQDRALFFLGDVLQLGIVKKEDLPAELLRKLKIVEY